MLPRDPVRIESQAHLGVKRLVPSVDNKDRSRLRHGVVQHVRRELSHLGRMADTTFFIGDDSDFQLNERSALGFAVRVLF